MSLQNVQNWYSGLPAVEKNQALIVLGQMAYTPNQVLDEVSRGTPVGAQLQALIEQRQFTQVMDKYGLAVIRLQQKLSQATANIIISDKSYSPQQLLQEVNNGTPLGRKLIEAEITHVGEVLS